MKYTVKNILSHFYMVTFVCLWGGPMLLMPPAAPYMFPKPKPTSQEIKANIQNNCEKDVQKVEKAAGGKNSPNYPSKLSECIKTALKDADLEP